MCCISGPVRLQPKQSDDALSLGSGVAQLQFLGVGAPVPVTVQEGLADELRVPDPAAHLVLCPIAQPLALKR